MIWGCGDLENGPHIAGELVPIMSGTGSHSLCKNVKASLVEENLANYLQAETMNIEQSKPLNEGWMNMKCLGAMGA